MMISFTSMRVAAAVILPDLTHKVMYFVVIEENWNNTDYAPCIYGFFFPCLYRIYLAEILSHVGCCNYSYLYSPFFPKCNCRVLAIFCHEKSFWSTIWWLSPHHSSWICNFLIKWYAAGAKSSFWPCRYLVWAIWNSILEVLPRNIDWKGNHQNPHSGLQCSIFLRYLIWCMCYLCEHIVSYPIRGCCRFQVFPDFLRSHFYLVASWL